MILRRYKLNGLQVKAVSDCIDEVCRICDYKKECNNISGCTLFSTLHLASMTKIEPLTEEKYIKESQKELEYRVSLPTENPFGKRGI